MIEVHPKLFVGSQVDFESGSFSADEWGVVHACKDPYHRQAVGYTGKAVAKTHPEYLIARRGHRLVLNLIDADTPLYIPAEIMDTAVVFIHEHLNAGHSVLVHCNQGCSRSPSIAMLYLATHTERLPRDSFQKATQLFSEMYPPFSPARGVAGFLSNRWISWSPGANGVPSYARRNSSQ